MYVQARAKKAAEADAFRIYITDCMQLIPQGKCPSVRYYDIIHPKADVDPDAIIIDIIERAGLEVC